MLPRISDNLAEIFGLTPAFRKTSSDPGIETKDDDYLIVNGSAMGSLEVLIQTVLGRV